MSKNYTSLMNEKPAALSQFQSFAEEIGLRTIKQTWNHKALDTHLGDYYNEFYFGERPNPRFENSSGFSTGGFK